MKPLQQLLTLLPRATLLGPADATITAIAYDSRQVSAGALFVALAGQHTDGHLFLEQALARGAAALAVQEDRRPLWEPLLREGPQARVGRVGQEGIALIVVPDSRQALSALAAALYDEPARHLRVVGVTGTDGKTTTCYLIAHLLQAAGHRAGLITTVAFRAGGQWLANDLHQTTPEAPEVQALLTHMAAAGDRWAVVEATSHGLAQRRLDHCYFDAAVFTNLAPDHLDFHGSMEEYLRAKGRLLDLLQEGQEGWSPATPTGPAGGHARIEKDKGPKAIVLNADEPTWRKLTPPAGARLVTYGLQGPADVRALEVEPSPQGTRFRLISPWGEAILHTRLLGTFNVYNCLAAAALALGEGIPLPTIAEALASFPGVPGRMERVEAGQPFTVVVDFAHAPNALAQALRALRASTEGRLIVLFGCAGERDPGRRFGMGRAAGELADFAVVTSDDPRSEDPQAIAVEVARGLQAAGRREGRDYRMVLERRQAIEEALALASPGDAVLLAGKGHEGALLLGGEAVPWDDRQVARELLTQLSEGR
ncbi:MAG TPA: UDP-N-acetylmuramoyl-L-alanyl-D-glutamate--2,6-diaminopimelate ligase [Dehalococcoidia bacterium]|nr:UDP-N-acetylmuramoyl-L-alanyl-D-glutamate--2,6-diaminopimelate ligase [Dehalococcoidia bacterium]